MRSTLSVLICSAVMAAASVAALHGFGNADFGLFRDHQVDAHSEQLFGIVSPVAASSTASIGATDANADPTSLITVAKGLRVHVLTAQPNAAPNLDQMVLWPNDQNPTHLIAANEEGPAQPALQRIRLSDGLVETILSGTSSADPVRRTPWGTILLGEENGTDGWLIEIANPLSTTNATFNRGAGTSSSPNVVVRPAPGRTSFEGIALYSTGVMYYADENRPLNGTPGGAYFKFIPTTPWNGQQGLANSPLGAGSVYGLRLGKRSGNTDYGQASETGLGTWVLVTTVPNTNLRAAAATLKLTGYYRPEDFEIDPKAVAENRVRFCANNTGNEGQNHNWGQTICLTDGTLAQALVNSSAAPPAVQFFVLGSWDFAMMDNIAYEPVHGNFVINEDGDGADVGRNNDIWSCLEDGDDADDQSDGCVRIATLNDLTAETTGGLFDKYGNHYYVSVQHNITGHGVVLDITGWR